MNLDAVAQAELVRRGEASPIELVDAAIARIEALEPKVHALSVTDFERAREAAKRVSLEGPLAGVPFLIKDLAAYPGLRCAMGSRLFQHNVRAEPTPYSERIDKAGLVVLGKTTTSELGMLGSTESLLDGVTHNPWDLMRSAGGSSGGSAAAVASRMVPIAHASDAGGSIRGPASMNGVFGFKPGRGRVAPTGPQDMHGLLIDHAVSVSVRDSALLLALTEVQQEGEQAVGYVEGPTAGRLRIGYYATTLTGAAPSAEALSILERTVELCSRLGHAVEEIAPPPIDGQALGEDFFALGGEAVSAMMAMVEPMIGRPIGEGELEPFTLALAGHYRTLPAGTADRARAAIPRVRQAMVEYAAGYDVLLCPTVPVEPWELGTLAPDLPYDIAVERMAILAGYTALHNFAGMPAMSVPLFTTARGLPLGSHFAGLPGTESRLLSLAYELEQAAPWAQRLPMIVPR